jgi:hypothetical protein
MVGGDADVRCALFDQLQHRVHDAGGRGPAAALVGRDPAQAVEVPEQLVGTVNEVNQHAVAGRVGRAVRADAHPREAAPRRYQPERGADAATGPQAGGSSPSQAAGPIITARTNSA